MNYPINSESVAAWMVEQIVNLDSPNYSNFAVEVSRQSSSPLAPKPIFNIYLGPGQNASGASFEECLGKLDTNPQTLRAKTLRSDAARLIRMAEQIEAKI